MESPFGTMRRLHDRGPHARGLVVDRDGVMLGPDCVLVRRGPDGYRCASPAEIAQLHGEVFPDDEPLGRLPQVLAAITQALGRGELAKAQLLGLEIPLDPLDDRQLARLARAAALIKANFNPDQPRLPAGSGRESGQWTAGGAAIEMTSASGVITHSAAGIDEAGKERFIHAHLAAVTVVAQRLGVTPAEILGLSALESYWGTSRFAVQGNNLFGLHTGSRGPLPYQTGTMDAFADGGVASFDSPGDSLAAFAATKGHIVRGITEPTAFARALQERGGFGWKDGRKVPEYVPKLAATIRGIQRILDRQHGQR